MIQKSSVEIIKFNRDSDSPIEVSDLRLLKDADLFLKQIPTDYYIHQVPKLPSWSDKEHHYKDNAINVFKLTCTCSQFKEKNELYKNRDIRKVCVHLYYRLSLKLLSEYIDQLSLLLITSAAKHGEQMLFRKYIDKQRIFYGFKNSNWVNIYYEVRPENYARFSYNPVLGRWSYGMHPGKDIEWKITYILERIIAFDFPKMHPLKTHRHIVDNSYK